MIRFLLLTLVLGNFTLTASAQFRGYRNHAGVMSTLQDLDRTFGASSELLTYGRSAEGRRLTALKLRGLTPSPTRPTLLITAATHGDERITTEALLRYLENLPRSPEALSRLQASLQRFDIVFIPVVSPDSFARTSRTIQGIDPNRSFPKFGDTRLRSPITAVRQLLRWADSLNLVGTLDVHAFGEVFLLPWAHKLEKIPAEDHQTMVRLAQLAAQGTGYQISKLTDFLGGRTAAGGSSDYWYWKHGAIAMGVELGQQKIPPPAQIPSITQTLTTILNQYFVAAPTLLGDR